MRWRPSGDGVELAVSVDFTGPWADTPYLHRDIWVPRIGLLFALPATYRPGGVVRPRAGRDLRGLL